VASNAAFPVSVHVGRTPEIIEVCDASIAVSGSVSLELMYRAKPTVVVYRMAPLSLWLARRLVKLPYFTLVNLLANEELFPEIATARDESDQMAGHVLGWLNNPRERDGAVAKLTALRNRVAVPGACDRAADFLLGDLGSQRRAVA
jgi:lipid-A-disaccharide synthase